MATVNFTTQEFTTRSDQAFDLADKGEKVIIRRVRIRRMRLVALQLKVERSSGYSCRRAAGRRGERHQRNV